MFTIFKKFWKEPETRKAELLQKLDAENKLLDHDIFDEKSNQSAEPASAMQNIIQANIENSDVNNPGDESKEHHSGCYTTTGVITRVTGSNGVLDNHILFAADATAQTFDDLRKGYKVEYLAYKTDADKVKVISILRVLDEVWDETENDTEKKIAEQIAELRLDRPVFFKTQQRSVLGVITKREKGIIHVDSNNKNLIINLDDVKINFVPKEGDCLYLDCKVQIDDSYVDKQGEILKVISLEPSRLQKQEKCTVKRVFKNYAILNDDIYATFDILPLGVRLHLGDVVSADIIECEYHDFTWRCINLIMLEKSFALQNQHDGNRKSNGRKDHRIATVSDDMRCVFGSAFQKRQVEFEIKNNCSDRGLNIKKIEIVGCHSDTQLRLIEPDPDFGPFRLAANETRQLVFEVESRFIGESKEIFIIHFETFRIKRSVTIIVCENEEEAKTVENHLKSALTVPMITGRNVMQRSRHYANQVWSTKSEVVSGEGIATRRRFVSVRISYFEVPERLRTTYLTVDRKHEMVENIESMYPCLCEEITLQNYTERFQTLLYLEEIEYFVSFRNYDRERAHFVRDGEFLSLTVENLAERRPSLVVGDIIRATDPFTTETNRRSYEGVIHKVFFNRIHLKFTDSFHNKYNGEDYRLEFYFSRFGFRKQHYAINRVVKHLGEEFLFPSKVQLRTHTQLDLRMNKDHEMLLYDSKVSWCNPILNPIQKRAIFNILRGETENMPYIVFGPPGTGKTITLVETILQLVRNLPGSRLLVGTPSNSSADLITQRIVDSNVLQQGEFVRLVSQNQVEKELIPDSLRAYCATVDIATDGTCSDNMIITDGGLKLRCQMKHLGRHRVTISTCTTLGNFIQMGFPPGHFTHVIIDEAGQCTEPEVMVPICQVTGNRGQVILAGDPHQLQAIVINYLASERELRLSFLERILKRVPYAKDKDRYPDTSGYNSRLVTKLLYNYRSLPSILNIYNELFYDSELVAMVAEHGSREVEKLKQVVEIISESSNRPVAHGAFFYGVCSDNMQEDDSPSWYNPGEAKCVFLMTIKLYRLGIEPKKIGIITPYMKQVKHLRLIFTNAEITMPKIGSVEEFQGQERDIILISTVRSTAKQLPNDMRQSLGFVQSAKRMNVAISRARYFMMIFGNPHLLALDNCWRTYIQLCLKNDAYIGCDLPHFINDDQGMTTECQIPQDSTDTLENDNLT